ncbi:MAG: hypothetical protein QOH56_3303, partial [Pseudonocardiales bacterium]|nr:hypothetical protein [Pseudonocardiales bacterium]
GVLAVNCQQVFFASRLHFRSPRLYRQTDAAGYCCAWLNLQPL